LFNYADMCDYCGTMWHRDKLVLDAEGKLRCPQEGRGLTPLELDDIAQANIGYVKPLEGKKREGP